MKSSMLPDEIAELLVGCRLNWQQREAAPDRCDPMIGLALLTDRRGLLEWRRLSGFANGIREWDGMLDPGRIDGLSDEERALQYPIPNTFCPRCGSRLLPCGS